MIFFGTSQFSIIVLKQLIARGFIPQAIVTVPDRPAGRKMLLTPPPLKEWAQSVEFAEMLQTQNKKLGIIQDILQIPILQFEKLNSEAVEALRRFNTDVFIVASYGKIIPQTVLDIPSHGSLNVHPSLLPKLRGATPLQTSIMLDMQHTGVTIIQMDKEMDHGPIVNQHAEEVTPWPQSYLEFEAYLGKVGADILADVLPSYLSGKAKLTEQNHDDATFTKKIEKSDGLILLNELEGEIGWNNFLKYNALHEWPGLFFFIDINNDKESEQTIEEPLQQPTLHQPIRVKVKEASWNTALKKMEFQRVIPEGKKEMTWKDFENYISLL